MMTNAEDVEVSHKVSRMIYKDHPSLQYARGNVDVPSSNSILKIYPSVTSQFVLEEEDGTITAKHIEDRSIGLSLLHTVYSIVALLMTGFLFVFCLNIVLFLFIGLTVQGGLTVNKDWNFFGFFGIMLSTPLFTRSLAQCMTLATNFVLDCWDGHSLIKSLSPLSWDNPAVIIDWTDTSIFLIIPTIVAVFSLYLGSDDWWTITALTWISSVFIYFILFAGVVIYYEIEAAFQLLRHQDNSNILTSLYPPSKEIARVSNLYLLRCAVLARQHYNLCGVKSVRIIETDDRKMRDVVFDMKSLHAEDKKYQEFDLNFTQLRSISWCWIMKMKVTQYIGMSKPLLDSDVPLPIYSLDEVNGQVPYVTKNTWNLAKLYFRDRQVTTVAVINGDEKLENVTDAQGRSSFIFAVVANAIGIILVSALLTWIKLSALYISLVVIMCLPFFLTKIWKMFEMYKTYNIEKQNTGIATISEVNQKFIIVNPTEKCCWVMLSLEVIFLFLFPLITLLAIGNTNVAIVFLFAGVITQCREFINSAKIVMQLGSLNGIEENNKQSEKFSDEVAEWREKHRVSKILSNISHGRSVKFWRSLFYVFVFLFCIILISAVTLEAPHMGDTESMEMTRDFLYEGSEDNNILYPTCELDRGFDLPDESRSALIDFTFLATLAYYDRSVTQTALNKWFGSGVMVIDENVADFRKTYSDQFRETAVVYKHFNFTRDGITKDIVAIRGTSNGWDALADAQLWASAVLSQVLRFMLPVGEIWTPIFPYLIHWISMVEKDSLDEVAYYKETVAFVNYLLQEGQDNITITGHSLGGGLAMITGAQTQRPAVALSGPNNVLSRKSFSPKLSKEDLERLTFNIIPDRDPVPMIDDRSRNFQRIRCTAPASNPADCHSGMRSLCEVSYQCGTQYRAVPCECYWTYGYPKPTAISGNITFEDACPKPKST